MGLEDSFETGKSLTIGIDYKKQMLNDMNKYFEIKLASVLRDKEEILCQVKQLLTKKHLTYLDHYQATILKI